MKHNVPTTVRVVVLPHAQDLPLPLRATDQAAGADLLAAVEQDLVLRPGERALVPTGLQLELPRNVEAQIRPRSGLALKHGVTVLNTPGTIDPDYRGEIKVVLINLGAEPFRIRRGERIAQMVFATFLDLDLIEAKELSATARGSGGFGSTGIG